MKTKTLIAFEPFSSVTIRLTVDDYAGMFQQVPESKIQEFFDKIKFDAKTFGDEKRREAIGKHLK